MYVVDPILPHCSVMAAAEESGITAAWFAEARFAEARIVGIRVDVAAGNRGFALGKVMARDVHDVLPVDVHNRMDERNFALGEGVMEAVHRRADDWLSAARMASAAISASAIFVSTHGGHLLSSSIKCAGPVGTMDARPVPVLFWLAAEGEYKEDNETAGRRQPDLQKERIVLFDGTCNFCDKSVQFIIKRDPVGHFKYASLQSDVGRELREKYKIPEDVDSMVLIEGDKAYTKSAAALHIAKKLDGLWHLAFLFIVVPKPIRDRAYDYIAANRFKWFGKKTEEEACRLPPRNIRERFLA